MKVFKMNDIDHVAAESEEQAKEYYKKMCGFDDEDIAEEYEGEVSLQNEMLVGIDDLPIEEQKQRQKMKTIGGHLYVYKTFEWVLKHDKPKQPYVICSTEW